MATAFVTGGSGFIGGKLIERLVADGHVVRAIARSESSADAVRALGAEPAAADLADADGLRTAADGCEIAYHSAAKVDDWGPWEEFERDTVQGTKNVVAACIEAGVKRFVHVGTEAATTVGQPLIDIDETAPLRPDSPLPYSRSKAIAEQHVLGASREGFETVSLRPRFVWGTGDTSLLPQILEAVRSGRYVWVGGGRHLTDTTHVDNVVEGILLAGERGRGGEAYYVTDGEPVVFREFTTAMLATQGVDPGDRSIPKPLARGMAAAAEVVWRALPLGGKPPLTRFALWGISEQCTLQIDKARRELGYEPVTTREQGLAAMRARASA